MIIASLFIMTEEVGGNQDGHYWGMDLKMWWVQTTEYQKAVRSMNGIKESPKIHPDKYDKLIFDKDAKVVWRKEDSLFNK